VLSSFFHSARVISAQAFWLQRSIALSAAAFAAFPWEQSRDAGLGAGGVV